MELLDVEPRIQRESVGRGRTAAGIVPLIEAARRPIQLELEKRRVKRQLFLDRARLASLLKIN